MPGRTDWIYYSVCLQLSCCLNCSEFTPQSILATSNDAPAAELNVLKVSKNISLRTSLSATCSPSIRFNKPGSDIHGRAHIIPQLPVFCTSFLANSTESISPFKMRNGCLEFILLVKLMIFSK